MRPAALIAALRVALQSRERQHQLRNLLETQRRVGIELQRARLEAEAADRAKDQFLATLSHELRTPLNAILGWIYLIRNGRNDPPLMAEALEVLQRNTSALIELISDLLDTSRIIAGNLTMEFEEVDLKQVIKASVETLRIQAAEKGIVLKSFTKISDASSRTVWGDEARLHQIFTNLLNNAVKFTSRGGSVTVHLTKAQANARVVVKDSGKGISPEFLPNIFRRFSRDETSSREGGGLGLGLAICKYLVELHGGSISAESEGLGRGAIMKVELPIVTFTSRPRDKRSGKRSLRKDKRTADIRLKSVKVLAVDDNSDSRVLLKEILECSSAEATVVSSGQEALAAFNNVHPDVLICDLAMPEMNGYELLKNIRSLGSSIGQIPAIAFTAAARTEDRAATRQAGFEAHLSKPVDPDALISTILELTGKHMGQHMRS